MKENKKGKVYMTIGLPCTGKSTYAKRIKQKYGDKCVVLDSDDIRMELFGEELQTQNKKVFEVMEQRTKQALKEDKDVIYCATNLNRKQRMHFINHVCKGYDVIGLFFTITLGNYLEKNYIRRYVRNIPTEKLELMYQNIDVPLYLEGFKKIYINNDTPLYFNKEKPIVDYLFEYDQNTPYHNQTLGNHIKSVVDYIHNGNIEGLDTYHRNILEIVGYFHDLGKPYTRTEIEDEKGARSRYFNHEKVSAYIYSMFISNGLISKENDMILTLIAYHMGVYSYKQNLSKLEKLVGSENYNLLLQFNQADSYREE